MKNPRDQVELSAELWSPGLNPRSELVGGANDHYANLIPLDMDM